MPLHLTKVAVACETLSVLAERNARRTAEGAVTITTRFRPRRAAEAVGGSLFWIIKHRLVARQTILGFDEDETARRCLIRLSPDLVLVRARPKRAHQGWRYLEEDDRPADMAGSAAAALPPGLIQELTELALL